MKGWLPILLRVLVAVAGVVFIVATLTWGDRVALPAGTPLPDGSVLHEPVRADVEEATLTRRSQPIGTLTLSLELDGHEDELVLQLPATRLGTRPDEPRFIPGVITTLRAADYPLLGLGLLLVASVFPLQAYRWLILLRARGYLVSFWRALRLTMVGQFFNFLMPGMTGGDVAKAWYAARHSPAHVGRGAAIMSVVFDRIAGLVGLVMLSGLVGLTMLDHPLVQRITIASWIATVVIFAIAGVYFSPGLRRRLRFERWYAWLPGRSLLHRIDAAAAAYSHHKTSVFLATILSLPVHFMVAWATALAGYAVGVQHPLTVMLTVVPMLLLAASLPISYQGIGVMEALAFALLLSPGLATSNQLVAMLLILRLYLVIVSLTGAIDLIRGDVHLHPKDMPPESDEPALSPATAPS